MKYIIEVREILAAGRFGYSSSREIGDPLWRSMWMFFATAWTIFKDWIEGRWWRTK